MMNGKRLRYSFMTYLLTAVVLSVLSGMLCDVRAQGCVNYGGERSEELLDNRDALCHGIMEEHRRTVANSVFRPVSQSRVAWPRQVKLTPTHGGKPHSPHSGNKSYNPVYHACILMADRILAMRTVGVSSPRLYYVIALRRLLC